MNDDLGLNLTENFDQSIPPSFLQIYTMMLRIRKFEECVADLIKKSRIHCPCHLYIGQEAIAAGVCAALKDSDWVFSTHRSHGHYIAKGGNIRTMMAELFGKDTGCSRGHGGSMHIASPEKGLPGSSAIVAGTISLAVGAGLAFSLQKKNNLSVVFFGDGATNEGSFYESLNFSSLHHLPIIFVCENNLYSTHMPIARCLANTKIYELARVFNIASIRIDGNNVREVYNATRKGIEQIRKGKGPVFIECMTYRWLGHVGFEDDIDQGLRSRDELDAWMSRCPIQQFGIYLLEKGILSKSDIHAISESIATEISDAVLFAETSPYPDPDDRNCHAQVYKEC